MSYLLKHTNSIREFHYFCNLGQQWPSDPMKRLIDLTTTDPSKARVFATEEAAREVLVTAGKPSGWEIVARVGQASEV